MKKAELAGKFMQLQQNEIFNEFQEGLLVGVPAGLSLIGTDTSLPQVALQTAGAVAGGFGIGLLGKRIGASLGKRINPNILKDQEGILAGFGRVMGQETMAKGAQETLRFGKGQIKQELKTQTSSQLMHEALQNPQVFAGKYGVDAETFKKYHSTVNMAGQGRAALETLENLSPEQRQQMGATAQKLMDQGFNQVENLINTQAAANMDSNIAKMALLTKNKTVPGTDINIGSAFESLLKDSKPVTGENVGRAVGRFIGDEVGAVTGLGLTGMLASSLGMQTEKDKKIKELESRLNKTY
jgi:hypothetical protein